MNMVEYAGAITDAIARTRVSAAPYGAEWTMEHATSMVCSILRSANKVFVVGNGGSAAMASHVATDLMRAGKAAMTLTDPAILTCMTNDGNYAHAFGDQLSLLARGHDALIAISSSGKSPNIHNACRVAKRFKLDVITFSGFNSTNELRGLGSVNFYSPSSSYGIVEMAHHVILHAVTDAVLAKTKKAAA